MPIRFLAAGLVFAAMCLGTSGLIAQQPANSNAGNTKVNKIDRSKAEPTSDQAKENTSDRGSVRGEPSLP